MSLPPQLQKVLNDVDRNLHEKSALTDALGTIEAKTGVKRLHIVLGVGAIQALYLIFGHFAGLVCNVVAFLYPAYTSILAIETATKDDDTQWLTYWVVFALFSVAEFFVNQILSVFPIYWLFKAVFCLWLYLPATRGATVLYNRAVRPFVLKHNSTIDQAARKVADTARDLASEVKQRLD